MVIEVLKENGMYVENASYDFDLEERLREVIRETNSIIEEVCKRKSLDVDNMSKDEEEFEFKTYMTVLGRIIDSIDFGYDAEMERLEEPENEEEP